MRPIWQAPTGSVAGPELCVAVTLAGGVGAMGLTWTPPEEAARVVREVLAEVGESPFLGNFALAFPPEALTASLEAGLPIVSFSWGDPRPWLPLCRSFGAKIAVQIANLDGAKAMSDAGADFLIAQGVEAGGHVQSTTALFDLLPQVAELGIPIIAAGGLVNGHDIRLALDAGASAAMLGTRFVATRESRAHPKYKESLVNGKTTALTTCFDGGWPSAPHRVLRNSTLERWEASGCPASGGRPGENETLGHAPGGAIFRYEDTAPRIGFEGEIEAMCLYAGTGVSRIDDLPSAAELMVRLRREAGLSATDGTLSP
ncbi:nitronate monooxygenase [bacterium]|nr:MAG: nitronate monooxygenase [bacterium]